MRHIALIIPADRFHLLFGDELLRFALRHPNWMVRVGELAPQDIPPLQFDALIIYFQGATDPAAYRALGLPIIALYQRPPGFKGPVVVQDNARIARQAADYFESLGLRQFGFVTYPKWVDPRSNDMIVGAANYSERQRQTAFCREARRRGIPCAISPDYAQFSETWRRPLEEWLVRLPKPAGLLCASDSVSNPILEACYLRKLAIPEQLSVLGISNDERRCALANPSLSSVAVALDRMAAQVGSLLETLFATGRLPAGTYRIEPTGVVERNSTAMAVLHDPVVSEALTLLRRRAHEPVNIKTLFASTSRTRRQFDRRFQQVVGRTPYDELCRLRVEHARNMLRETALTYAAIAASCGFSNTTHMRRVFLAVTGQPPQAIRGKPG